MNMNDTTPLSDWPEPWPATRTTADQPATLREQLWALHLFRHADDLPPGGRWEWCRYMCLAHVRNHPGRVIEEVGR